MKTDTECMLWRDRPEFLLYTKKLAETMRALGNEELKKLWKCNDAITDLNAGRMRNMDLYSQLTPAILSYEGIQYQYMAPMVFSDIALDYIENPDVYLILLPKIRLLMVHSGLLLRQI